MTPVTPQTPSPDAPVGATGQDCPGGQVNQGAPGAPVAAPVVQIATQVTVQPVPFNHPYSKHILPVDLDTEFTVLTDPKVPDAPEGQWWPPRALDADWIQESPANLPDILHVHFGFEHYSPMQLRRLVEVLHRAGSALVLTVHDLENPHLADQRAHQDQLDVLIPAADELITLTHGAAAEIERRWGRTATVLPHPHVLPLEQLPQAAPAPGSHEADQDPQDGPRDDASASVFSLTPGARRQAPASGDTVTIGVHAKDLRANVDPLSILEGLQATQDLLQAQGIETTLRLDARRDGQRPDVLDTLRSQARDRGISVWEHGRLGDDELAADLLGLDVSVLPYAFGTHSGWVELCRDLGVPVVVNDVGFVAEQAAAPTPGAPADAVSPVGLFTSADPQSLASAVDGLLQQRGRIHPATREARAAQRDELAAAHAEIYNRALAVARSRTAR